MPRLVVWGCGELGGRVAARWQGPALGLTRTEEKHDKLREQGVQPELGSTLPWLQSDDLLLLSLPGHERQQAAVAALAGTPPPRRAVFISTTGYYGTPTGVVNEQTPVGESARAQSIAAAEHTFRAWAGERGVILRLGGLYGPGRGPMAALARRGTVRLRPPDRTLALIHYDDVATAVSAALTIPAPQPIYLAVTPPCPTRRQFYEAACRRLDLPPPDFAPALNRPPARFDVSLLRRDLLPIPAYPHWRAALATTGKS